MDAKTKTLLDRYTSDLNNPGEEAKPVAVVGKLSSLAQELFPDEANPTQTVQDAYIQLLTNRGLDLNQARQSWVTASGGSFEGYIRNHLNESLNPHGLVAIKGDRLKRLGKTSANIEAIIEFLTLPAKRRCTQTSVDVWPDNDILVLSKLVNGNWRVLASISAKTSSHSRNTSVLFWALAVTPLGIKYFLATQDRDDQFVKECNSQNVNQERKLFEAYCDRIFTSNPRASYCSQVKSLIVGDDGSSELTRELLDLATQALGQDREIQHSSLQDLERY